MKSFRDIAADNLPWIITTLLAIGAFAGTVNYQGKAIESANTSLNADHERIISMEKALVRVELMQNDIQEIKSDIKDIKHIVLKPAITGIRIYDDEVASK